MTATASDRGLIPPRGSALVVGHRGAAGVAPENTLPSLRRALEAGADTVEVDIQCTADDRLVLLHDPTLDRTTDGSGPVEEHTLEEVRTLDAGHGFTPDDGRTHPYRGEGVRVPTLAEAVELLEDRPLVVEVKSERGGRRLGEWLEERPTVGRRVLVGGFSHSDVLPAARHARWRGASRPEVTRYALLSKVGLGGVGRPDADALLVPERRGLLPIVTRRFVRRAHRDGLPVYVWTVNRPDAMRRLLDRGVDGILSDFPARLRRVLDGREARGG